MKKCPICGSAGNPKRISSILASNSFQTTGYALTRPVTSFQLDDLSISTMRTQTNSNLFIRLCPPDRPKPKVVWFAIGALGLFVFMLARIALDATFPTFLVIASIVAIVALVVAWVRSIMRNQVAIDFWSERTEIYLQAYYCDSDDIIFDGIRFASPEKFREWSYTPD